MQTILDQVCAALARRAEAEADGGVMPTKRTTDPVRIRTCGRHGEITIGDKPFPVPVNSVSVTVNPRELPTLALDLGPRDLDLVLDTFGRVDIGVIALNGHERSENDDRIEDLAATLEGLLADHGDGAFFVALGRVQARTRAKQEDRSR